MKVYNDQIESSVEVDPSSKGASVGISYTSFTPPTNGLVVQGNVGIGTTSPTQSLHVQGNMRLTGAHFDSNNAAGSSGNLLTSTATGTAWSTPVQLGVVTGTGAATQIAVWNNNNQLIGYSTFVYYGIGSVGIGTATPSNTLTVQGDALINNMTVGLSAAQQSDNSVIGFQALQTNTNTATANTIFGYQASQGSATSTIGSFNVIIGKSAAQYSATTNSVVIGNGAGQYASNSVTGQNVVVGASALSTTSSTNANQAVIVGFQAGKNYAGAGAIIIGRSANDSVVNSNANSIYIGYTAGRFNTAANVVAIGANALAGDSSNTISGNRNVAVGDQVAQYLTGANNVIMGFQAAQGSTTTVISTTGLTYVGYQVAQFANGNNNTAVGFSAYQGSATVGFNTGIQNTILGSQAGQFLFTGSNNIAIGRQTLAGSATSSNFATNTVIVGTNSAQFLGGTGNVGIGQQVFSSTQTANYMIAIGGAGSITPTGSNLGAWGSNANATRTDLGIGTYTAIARLHVETLAAANKGLYIAGAASQTGNFIQVDATTSGTNYFTIYGGTANAGYVGIATATPSQHLHVQGNFRLTGTFSDASNAVGSSGNLLTSTATGTAWSTPVQLGIVTGTAAANQIAVWNSANQLVGFSTFVRTGLGSFGFGTATPSQLVQVQGNIRITGGLYDSNNSIGSANSVLSSTGSGLAWIAQTGGGGGGTINGSIALNQLAYGSGANTIQGTSLLSYSATTGLGVNTSQALSKLHVRSSTAAASVFKVDGTAGNLFEITDSLTGTLYSVNNISGLPLMYVTDGVSNPIFNVQSVVGLTSQILSVTSNAGASYLSVTSGGNVGIGTSSATQSLHVQGNMRLTGSLSDSSNSTGASGTLLKSIATGTAWSTPVQLGLVTGSAASNQIAYWSNPNQLTGISTFVYSGTNVGIGTATPSQLLHVQGSQRLTGSLYDTNNLTGSPVGIITSALFSTGTGVTWAPIKRSLVMQLMTAFTPTSAGVDSGVFIIPQDPNDGSTSVSFSMKRVNIRVETPSTGITTINISKSTTTGAFSGTNILSSNVNVTGASTYEFNSTSFTGFGATANSGDKLSVNFVGTAPTFANFTVQVIARES